MLFTALLGILLVFLLLTKRRYRWIYILYKTIPRDLKAIVRFSRLNAVLWNYERKSYTVVKVFDKFCKKHPEKVAFYFEDDVWTFKQVDDLSNKIGNYFKSLGYKPGDSVALLLETRPEYVCMWLGLAKIGVVTALINTNLTNDSLMHSIQAAKANSLIFGSDYAGVVNDVKTKLSELKYYQFHEGTKTSALLKDAVDLRQDLESSSTENLSTYFSKGTPKDKLVYIYTSGTTGLPKAAVITNIRFFFMSLGVTKMTMLSDTDILYDPLPLYHSAGGMIGVGQCLLAGITVALRKKFSASNFWKDCVRYNCTAAQYIGETCRYLLAVPQKGPIEHNVHTMFGNGLKPQIWNQFKDRFSVKYIYEFYGATEGNSNLVNIDNKSGAVGFVPRYTGGIYPVTLIKCDEATGDPLRNTRGRCMRCTPGEPGVFIGKINPRKAVSQFSGYADKQATEKKIIENVFKDGDLYFNSGDILVQDELGYYYFKDRTGDTFRWKGENVATSEVEAVISNIVNLSDAVVYGVQIPNTDGRAGMAAIVDTNDVLDIPKLAEGLKANLPAYALPLFIRVMQSVPMTGTFKLKKVDLQADGYDINKVKDVLYFYSAKSGDYKKLTDELYEDITTGKLRL